MDNCLYLIDEAGLNTPEKAIRAAKEWPIKRISEIREQLWEILQAASAPSPADIGGLDPFDFVASASMRGEDGCFAWDCRVQKARALSRYGALYARRVLIPVRLGVLPTERSETEFNQRYGFAGTILSILEYRPLIENGIASLTAGVLCYCSEHLNQAVPTHPRIEAIAESLFQREFKNFSVKFDLSEHPFGGKSLLISGPEAYLPHGRIWHGFFGHAPQHSNRSNGRAHGKRRSPLPSVVKRRAVRNVFQKIAYDVTLQQFYTLTNNLTYLTDMMGEARVLDLLDETGAGDSRTGILSRHLLHAVPLLSEVPLSTVIKIRQSEPDAFIRYRAAIAKIIAENIGSKKELTVKDAKNLFTDVLEPELAGLRTQARLIRRSSIRKAAAKAVASFAAVGLGVYGGLLPSDLAALLKVTGGVGILSQIGEAAALIEKNPGEIKNHNLYFLLKLQAESGR